MFLYIQLLNFLISDSFFNAVILIQSCFNVHFKVFHLEMENTYEIKRQKKFRVRAMLMVFCFFLRLL